MLDLRKLLRLQEEPHIYLDDLEVHRILTEHRREYFDHFEEGFRFWAAHPDKLMLTPKQIYYSPGMRGDFRVMPCQMHREGGSVNIVKLIGTNEEEELIKDKISVGKAFLFHPRDNFIIGVFDACVLSSVRTGACAALGFKHLGKGARRVGIIGCGRCGYYSAEFIHQQGTVEKFLCFDTNAVNLENFKELAKVRNIPCEFPRTLEEVKKGSDALVLSTYSPSPLVSGSDLEKYGLRFISSSGADADNLSEMEEDVPRHVGRIFVDVVHSLRCADLKRWKQKGLITDDTVVELREVIGGAFKPEETHNIFVTTGFAYLDLLTIDYLYSFVAQKKNGTLVKN
ncbi:MAG: hypothetical protein RDV48_08690 [Candidatus Eremiobacteraeota bacterium]|nr:hypothetical protein [Candidatus Eremiobacteraeota bacterium]